MTDDLKAFLNREDVHKESADNVPAWNTKENKDFKEGSYVLGVLVEKRKDVGANNSNLYVIEQRGGEKIAVWGSALIDSRLENKQIGQEMAVIYKGKATSEKTGRQYHDFEFHFAEYKGSGEIEDIASELFDK